ncbi:MAG: DUF3343 domain-containing protein [Bacteroidales bacterium]|nr:DUF3343 domain-containing protein [Bacteroidales bacterium]
MPYHIFTFSSTHHVLKAEKLLISRGIKHEIIPTPKNISSDCGMSIRISPDISEPKTIADVLDENDIQYRISMQP